MKEIFVVPGEKVKTEKLAGPGLYKDGGKTYACLTGTLREDGDEAYVEPVTEIFELERGDVVITTVESTREKIAILKILKIVGKQRGLPSERLGVVRVMDIASGYTESAADEFKVGDIVKAEVSQVLPNDVVMTTKAPNLGVIEGYCSKCRGLLKEKEGKLSCTTCNKIEQRKTSTDYLYKEE